MECSNIKSAFIRPEFLLCCLICGRKKRINEAPFRRLGNESGNQIEVQLADLVKSFIGVVVNQALCCKTCFTAVKVLENKSKLLKDKCKKAVKSVTFFVTSDSDEDHNYHIRSDDKFVGSLISEDYENILPAEIIISNDNIYADSIQETNAIVHEGHMCLKCDASFATIHALRKHHIAEHATDKAVQQAEQAENKDVDPEKDLAQDRKRCHMSLRKNPRISVKSQSSNSSPNIRKKSTIPNQLSQSVSDEEYSDEVPKVLTNSRMSVRKSLLGIKSKFPDYSPAKKSKIEDRPTTAAQYRRSGCNVNVNPLQSLSVEDTIEGEDTSSVLTVGKIEVKPQKLFNCSHCPAKFTSSLNCSAHKELHEFSYWEPIGLEKDPSVDNDKQYQCKICGLEFSSNEESFLHMRKEHSDKSFRYKCKICSKTFTNVTSLRAHLLKTHSANKPFKCHCGKAFAVSEGLARHQLIHTRVQKSNLCQFCGKLFTTKDTLDYHTKSIHLNTVIKNQICDICGKAFDRLSKLDVHKGIHKKEKDFLCDTCGHQFRDLNVLKLHRKNCTLSKADEMVEETGRSSDEKQYNLLCKACLRTFPNLSVLTDHVTVAHEKECIGCGVSITSYKALRAHKDFCSIGDMTKSVSHSNRLMSLVKKNMTKEKKEAESPVNTRETKLLKLSENVAVQHTGVLQEDDSIDTPITVSEPSGDSGVNSMHVITSSNTDLADDEHNYGDLHSETMQDLDQNSTQHKTTSASVTNHAKLLNIVNGLHSVNSQSVVTETASLDSKQTIEAENQAFLTDSLTNEQIVNESVVFQVNSNIFPTESVTNVSSFVNPSNIYHSFQSSDSVDCINSLQSEGQETLYVVLQDGMNASEVQYTPDQKIEYIQLEDGQIIPSTEQENVTIIDSDLPAIEQNATVEFLSPETQ